MALATVATVAGLLCTFLVFNVVHPAIKDPRFLTVARARSSSVEQWVHSGDHPALPEDVATSVHVTGYAY